ncbi:MAG: DUF6597 domain-containing transcriptional factor [Bacteroidales bacterium]
MTQIEPSILYQNFAPHSLLSDYIDAYWVFRIQTQTSKSFDIFPDGNFDLLIVIRNQCISSVQITGLWSKPVHITYTNDTEVVGIRFKPLALGSLLRFNVKDYLDGSIPVTLNDVGVEAQVLLEVSLGFPQAMVNYFDSLFLKQLRKFKIDMRLKRCFDLMYTTAGGITVDDISQKVGISSRQLNRIINQKIGVGPKDYAKIVRFKSAMYSVKEDRMNYLHYYDQSHFIREVKRFAGATPHQLDLKHNDRYIQYFDFEGL